MKNLMIAVSLLCLSLSALAAEPAKGAKAPEPAPAKAPETKTVEGVGEADVGSAGLAAAKEKSKEAALRDAVQKVTGSYVSSFSETKDSTLMQDIVATHTLGYVKKFDLVDVSVKDDVVTTKVRAEIGVAAIDADAAAVRTLISLRKQKKVYVSIDDVSAVAVTKEHVATIRHGVFETRLRDALRNDGFTCIDPNIADNKLRSKATLQSIGTVQEALEVANMVGADIVIYGHATIITRTEELAGGSATQKTMLTAASISVDLHVTTTDTREILADYADTVTNDRPAFNSESATKLAADAAAAKAVKAVRMGFFEAWRKKSDVAEVDLTVTGVKDFGVLTAFKDLLKNQVRGVKDIASARFEKGTATMQVSLSGSADGLASDLQGKSFKGLTINVTKATNNTLELALGK